MKDRHLNERALIDACIRHESQALHELFVRYHRAVYAGAARAIRRRLGICGTADDLTAQFFLQVVEDPERMLPEFVGRAAFPSWLTAVSFRRCSMILRSHEWRWPGPRPITQAHDLELLPASANHTLHRVDIVRRALDRLDDPSRAIIEMRFGLGLCTQPEPIAEIAKRLGCSYRTVRRRLREAIRQFRLAVHAVQDNLDE